MNTNFHNFQLVMGKLFPKKTKLLNTLLAFGLGELKLGDSLKLLDPLTRQKFSFLKFFQQKFKANDLILLDGVHPVLMSSELIREMAFQIFEDLVAENVKLVLVSRIF